jgi:hypothetical protein
MLLGLLADVFCRSQHHSVGTLPSRGRRAYVWGHLWLRLQIEFHCDNSAVVGILTSGSSRDPFAMLLLRRLTMVA